MYGLYISVMGKVAPSLDVILCLQSFTISGSSYPGLNPTLPLSELKPVLLVMLVFWHCRDSTWFANTSFVTLFTFAFAKIMLS